MCRMCRQTLTSAGRLLYPLKEKSRFSRQYYGIVLTDLKILIDYYNKNKFEYLLLDLAISI